MLRPAINVMQFIRPAVPRRFPTPIVHDAEVASKRLIGRQAVAGAEVGMADALHPGTHKYAVAGGARWRILLFHQAEYIR